MRCTWSTRFCFVVLVTIVVGCAPLAQAPRMASPATLPSTPVQTVTAELAGGHLRFDLYLPASTEPRPLVVVAHGWLRDRTRMVGWGNRMAEEGFIAAIPDLPTLSDHPHNGRAMNA